jgi:hypothetical protein
MKESISTFLPPFVVLCRSAHHCIHYNGRGKRDERGSNGGTCGSIWVDARDQMKTSFPFRGYFAWKSVDVRRGV